MWGSVTSWLTGVKSRTGSKGRSLRIAGLMVNDAATTRTVWPSGAAFATSSVPLRLPAPGRLSTITFCLSVSVMRCAMTRATTSVDPPPLCGTISRTGRVG